MLKITKNEIESLTKFKVSEEVEKMLEDFNLEYESLSQIERDETILSIVNHLNVDLIQAGQHRLNQWENGWSENFELLKNGKSIVDLVPKYFGKNKIMRWNGDLIKSQIKNFDYKQLIVFVDSYLHEYVGHKFENLFEFGCGPSYHLLRFGEFNKNINLVGLDWTKASQTIISEIRNLGINQNISGHNFDFFNPDYGINIPPKSAIFTCSALEQMGNNFVKLVDYLIDKKPDLCINFEPMTEFLDENKLIDKLSVLYSQKRNYLDGYLSYLENLQEQGKIEIIHKNRLYGGSIYLEGYPVVIWKPI